MLDFRQFEAKDWKEFQALFEEAFSRENIKEENFLNLVDDDGFIGAFVKNKLVGYLRMLVLDDYGHLGQIAVEKTERGKGYGKELMEYALEYFEKKSLAKIGLYVETKNLVAINLYEKYGFKKIHESWHYLINKENLTKIEVSDIPLKEVNLRILSQNNFDEIMSIFPDINCEELKSHLSETQKIGLSGGISLPLGLFVNDRLEVYGRFNPEFPGCRPFWITATKYFDEFVKQIKKYKKKDYLRITFDRDKELAEFFEKRNYKLWHNMYFLERS